MNTMRPITEDDIQGYVDGALEGARRREVDDHLSATPESAARVSRMIEQRRMLRESLAGVIDEPVPDVLSVRGMLDRRRSPSRRSAWLPIAAAVLLTVGGFSGWAARDLMTPDRVGLGALTQEAFYTYSTFGADVGRPVELDASKRDDLVRWMSRHLQRPVDVPDLASAGYGFIGGRVVPTSNGAAGMFMYEDQAGERIAVVLRPMKIEDAVPMREGSIESVGTVSWVDAGIGYSLVGNASSGILHPIADEVRRQIRGQV